MWRIQGSRPRSYRQVIAKLEERLEARSRRVEAIESLLAAIFD
jgi:hypothetical protein